MSNYRWATGFVPPKGVEAEDVARAIDDLDTPSPEALYEASKAERHCLHNHLWSEGDQVWAQRARKTECRHIIGGLRKTELVGSKEITYRPTEFVTQTGWVSMKDIVNDPNMHFAYMLEIQRLQQQALAKMETFAELLRANDKA